MVRALALHGTHSFTLSSIHSFTISPKQGFTEHVLCTSNYHGF